VFSQNPQPHSASDLARQLDLPKSTVVDLCQSLASSGCLRREQEHYFVLGDTFSAVSRGLFHGYPLLPAFDRAVDQVAAGSDRTFIMAVLDRSDIGVVAVRHGGSVLPITVRVGLYLPAWTTASGMALLSGHSVDELAELLMVPSVTAFGVPGARPTAKELFDRIAAMKDVGYYVDQDQTAHGMCGVSAPVHVPKHAKPVAAITVAAIADDAVRNGVTQMGELIKRVGRQMLSSHRA
jgi:DNA-binding IclR family transcriptional regulator